MSKNKRDVPKEWGTEEVSKILAFGGIEVDKKHLEQACRELGQFISVAERLLREVESDYSLTANFIPVAQKLVKVKGDARQMRFKAVGDLAEVAEELAIKGASAEQRPVIRRVVGALWDAITTIKHMLDHVGADTSDEAEILMKRLNKALDTLGGPRARVAQEDIGSLFPKMR